MASQRSLVHDAITLYHSAVRQPKKITQFISVAEFEDALSPPRALLKVTGICVEISRGHTRFEYPRSMCQPVPFVRDHAAGAILASPRATYFVFFGKASIYCPRTTRTARSQPASQPVSDATTNTKFNILFLIYFILFFRDCLGFTRYVI